MFKCYEDHFAKFLDLNFAYYLLIITNFFHFASNLHFSKRKMKEILLKSLIYQKPYLIAINFLLKCRKGC